MNKIIATFEGEKRQCPIFIENDLIGKISEVYDLSKYSKAFVITDEIIKPLFLEKVLSGLNLSFASIVLPTGEKEKNIENIQKIWNAMLEAKCDRRSVVINLGGGVICDMGGFAAATYMRGVDFINIPTTLLAQVDASIGGKTGFSFSGIKNLIGTFKQAKAIIIDTQLLKTLPKREFLSGFAEILKQGLIADEKYFAKISGKNPLEFSERELVEIISKSTKIKKSFAEKDELETSERKVLNFGHTIGHAIESLSLKTAHPLLHGEAVSIGMVAESKISQEIGYLSDNDVIKIELALKDAGLPTSISNLQIDEIKKKMLSDKKNNKGVINFVLLKKIGKALIDQKVSEEIVDKVLKYVLK